MAVMCHGLNSMTALRGKRNHYTNASTVQIHQVIIEEAGMNMWACSLVQRLAPEIFLYKRLLSKLQQEALHLFARWQLRRHKDLRFQQGDIRRGALGMRKHCFMGRWSICLRGSCRCVTFDGFRAFGGLCGRGRVRWHFDVAVLVRSLSFGFWGSCLTHVRDGEGCSRLGRARYWGNRFIGGEPKDGPEVIVRVFPFCGRDISVKRRDTPRQQG